MEKQNGFWMDDFSDVKLRFCEHHEENKVEKSEVDGQNDDK